MARKRKSEDEIIRAIETALRPLCDLEKLEAMSLYDGGPKSASVFISPFEIRFITRHYNKLKIVTDSGEYFLEGGIADALKKLSSWPFLVRTHLQYVINLDRVQKIVWAPEDIGDYTVTLLSGEKIPLTETYSKDVEKYYGLTTLKNVVPYSKIAEILRKEGIKEWEKDLRKWDKKELEKEFKTSGGQVNVARLVRNLLWQTYQQIKRGTLPQIDGNIRSYWYSHVKSLLSRLEISEGTDHYQTLIGMFARLAVEYRLFKYKEFGLKDEREFLKNIGKENARVILFAEKRGFADTLDDLHHDLGVTTICLAGQASQLSTEYFVEDLSKVFDLNETNFEVFALTDYDPAGWSIMEEFFERLEASGLKVSRHNLMRLDQFTKKEIEEYKYSLALSGGWEVQLEKWMKLTGGIDGKPFGLEIDAKPRTAWKATFKKEAKPYLTRAAKRPELSSIQLFLKEITEVIEDYHRLDREEMRRRLYSEADRFIEMAYGKGQAKK